MPYLKHRFAPVLSDKYCSVLLSELQVLSLVHLSCLLHQDIVLILPTDFSFDLLTTAGMPYSPDLFDMMNTYQMRFQETSLHSLPQLQSSFGIPDAAVFTHHKDTAGFLLSGVRILHLIFLTVLFLNTL